jgi:hypothetical protein
LKEEGSEMIFDDFKDLFFEVECWDSSYFEIYEYYLLGFKKK